MLQFLANGICKGSVFALVGLGFGLIYSTTRVFHLAHAGIYLLAGYVLYFAMSVAGLSLPLAVGASLLVSAGVGVAIDLGVYQPLNRRAATPAVVMISSLGVQIVMENSIAMGFGNQTQILRAGVEQTFALGSAMLTRVQIAEAITGVLLCLSFWLFLKYTRIGQICRAVADDEILASVLGIRVRCVRLVVFAVGSAFAATGSILAALDVGMDPHVGFSAVLAAAVACIIGGLRSFLAPALGGILLGITQSLVVWRTSTKWEGAVTFGLLILFLLFRRQGLVGVVQRAEET